MADIEKAHDYHIDPELEKKVPPAYADAIRRGSVPEEILKHSHDADEALKAVQLHEGQVLVLDEATNKRILRRIDYNLLPVCVDCLAPKSASVLIVEPRLCVLCMVSWFRQRHGR